MTSLSEPPVAVLMTATEVRAMAKRLRDAMNVHTPNWRLTWNGDLVNEALRDPHKVAANPRLPALLAELAQKYGVGR